MVCNGLCIMFIGLAISVTALFLPRILYTEPLLAKVHWRSVNSDLQRGVEMVVSYRANEKVRFYSLRHPISEKFSEWPFWSVVLIITFDFYNIQIPPLFVVYTIFVVYGFIQPYKEQLTNILEMVVLGNLVLLLTLESTAFLNDVYSVFPQPLTSTAASQNATVTCVEGIHGVSDLTKVLLPFYYAPLFLFAIVAAVKLVLYIM